MMSADFHLRGKIPVAILGATGCVGQKFIQLLENHPWFEIVTLCASERSINKPYKEAVNWLMPTPIPSKVANMIIQPCIAPLPLDCSLVFSGLDSIVAGEIETKFAKEGYVIVSNSNNHRMDPTVPLVIGEVNSDHLALVKKQSFSKGMIITNPNCCVVGLTIALKPLFNCFGIQSVHVVTLQAISGAGYPGVPSLDILDNIIPHVRGEEEKIKTEPLKILGELQEHGITPAVIKIGAQCNRVPVQDGHTECVMIKLNKKASKEEIINAWEEFAGEPQHLVLPSAPRRPIHYFHEEKYPQPRLHAGLERGMAVSIGQLKESSVLDYQFTLLSHNTIRGAAGCALLNAELLVMQGFIFW